MAKQFLTDVDLRAQLQLAGSAGTAGQVIVSSGPDGLPSWGSAVNSPVLQPAYVINENVTLGTSKHGLSLYSVEVAAGYSVTVPAGATWTIADL